MKNRYLCAVYLMVLTQVFVVSAAQPKKSNLSHGVVKHRKGLRVSFALQNRMRIITPRNAKSRSVIKTVEIKKEIPFIPDAESRHNAKAALAALVAAKSPVVHASYDERMGVVSARTELSNAMQRHDAPARKIRALAECQRVASELRSAHLTAVRKAPVKRSDAFRRK